MGLCVVTAKRVVAVSLMFLLLAAGPASAASFTDEAISADGPGSMSTEGEEHLAAPSPRRTPQAADPVEESERTWEPPMRSTPSPLFPSLSGEHDASSPFSSPFGSPDTSFSSSLFSYSFVPGSSPHPSSGQEGPLAGGVDGAPPLSPSLLSPADHTAAGSGLDEWYEWTKTVPMGSWAPTATEAFGQHVLETLPTPDRSPRYQGLDDEGRRDAWRSWWLAAALTSTRLPAQPASPLPMMQTGPEDEYNETGDPEKPPTSEPDPLDPIQGSVGVRPVWRKEAHGSPRTLHAAGDSGAALLVTDRGVLYLDESGEKADWMLRTQGVASHSEATSTAKETMLVVSAHPFMLRDDEPSLRVVAASDAEIVYEGQSGDEALAYWRLTDIDGDGEEDILAIDVTGRLVALRLDGEEIYRKPLPSPDLPEQGLPVFPEFLFFALEQTGAELFGDATGDGTLDVFVTHLYQGDVLFIHRPGVQSVTLVDGRTGQEQWTSVFHVEALDHAHALMLPVATGDLDGDSLADAVLLELRDWSYTRYEGLVMHVVAGSDGRLLAQDDMRQGCPPCYEPDPFVFEPLAVVDPTGSGDAVIIGFERRDWRHGEIEALQVRGLPEIEGLPTEEIERTNLSVAWTQFPYSGHFGVRTLDSGKQVFLLFAHDAEDAHDDPPQIHRYDDQGYILLEPKEPIGHYDLHTLTGQAYVWTLKDDRWVPVDGSLERQEEGADLRMSVAPLLIHDREGDGRLDLLVARSNGYSWLDGATGEAIDDVDRPLDVRPVRPVEHQDRVYMLEHDNGELSLFDMETEETVWVLTKTLRGDGSVVRVGDFTRNGELEVLIHRVGSWEGDFSYGGSQSLNMGSSATWVVVSPGQQEVVWEHPASSIDLWVLPESDGDGILTARFDDQKQQPLYEYLRLDREEPLWNRTMDARLLAHHEGRLLFRVQDDQAEDPRYEVVSARTGSTLSSWVHDEPDERVWFLYTPLMDGAHPVLVESYVKAGDGTLRQFVRITAPPRSETLDVRTSGHFRVSDPELRVWTSPETGESHSWYAFTGPGPRIGDWTGNGAAEIALTESGRGVVRSTQNGSLVAVAPEAGRFAYSEDLNGDGQRDLVMLSEAGTTLRAFAYDPDSRLEEDSDLTRLSSEQGSWDASWDEEDGSGFWFVTGSVLLGIAGLAGGAIVHRRRRKA